MKNRITLSHLTRMLAVIYLVLSLPSQASELKLKWQIENLDQPESVVINPQQNALYISNINGQPNELNGQGYISKVSTEGEVIDKYWLKNLDAPKGMAIYKGYLYIADMQHVYKVNISQARIVKQFKAEQASMLNDISIADDGSVFISDLIAGGIYRIIDDQITAWFNHQDLPHPNGLLWHQGKLLIASWGLGMRHDFTTQTAGSIYSLNIHDPKLLMLKGSEQLGNLDGLIQHKDAIYVSDWISGELFKVQDHQSRKILSLKPGLADIAKAGSLLLAPSMLDGTLSAWQL
jgi:hypothetical protein